MADPRNPSGRRGPAFPLPPPPEDEAFGAPYGRHQRPPSKDVTSELPRLPEVHLHDESSEVRVDQRALAPNRRSLTGARALPQPPRAPELQRPHVVDSRRARPAAPERPPEKAMRPAPPVQPAPLPAATPKMINMHTPLPPQRSPGPRVHTVQHSALIGGRYLIQQRIGQGGMGKVYKVTHTHLSRTFALKIISNTVAETDEARELFYREARFASAMAHPGITSVVDFGEDEKVGMFMVMEFVDGEPLNRMLFREKRINPRKACEIVLQVAEALHYIHKQNVVHCDIKTENILIHEEEGIERARNKMIAKLLDFGLARSLVASRASTSLSGTPHYVAPERIRGEPASPASDVYSIGILLYELICGAVPWDGPVQKILAGHLDEKPKPPSEIVEGMDQALETLILHALEKRPVNRHKDMAAFIYELRTVMDMMGFGRRARGAAAGAAKRVVIEQRAAGNERDELARIAFDACRLPLALLAADGTIVTANQAFAKFVMGVAVQVEGLPVKSTALANAWATADQDIRRTLGGQLIRRIIEIDVSEGEVRRLLLWLDSVSPEQVLLGVQPLDL